MDHINPLEELRSQVASGRAVVVVGAGVSKAVARVPDWLGAVASAISHIERIGIATADDVADLRTELAAAGTPGALIACAERVRSLLTGDSRHSGEFAAWLQRTFDVPRPQDAALLRAIIGLPAALFATTNYDKLLSQARGGLEAVSWREPHRLQLVLEQGNRVVHLHGEWDDPDSVVFGTTDYGRVVANPAYQTFLRALWLERTLVFVGTSFDGLRDPDFLALLEWTATTFPHATNRHFALIRAGTYTPARAAEFLTSWRIQLVPYGERYEDLGPFLERLTPQVPSSAPLPPRVFAGRADQVRAIQGAICAGQDLLVHGMGGIGKTSVVAEAIAQLRLDPVPANVVWIEQVGSSVNDLARQVARALGRADLESAADRDLPAGLKLALSTTPGPKAVVLDDPDSLAVVRDFAARFVSVDTALLATSRNRAVDCGQLLEIGALDKADSVEVFTRTTGALSGDPLVPRICALLEGHPLAIVLAAGRHAAEALPLDRLFERLAEEKHRLDTLRDPEQAESPATSVRASLTVSLEGISTDLEGALEALAAFPADTSVELLASALGLDVVTTEDRVGRLIARSLIQRGQPAGHALHLHPLVRDAARERRSDEEREITASSVERAIISLLTEFDETSGESQRRIINDVDNVVAFVLNTNPSHPDGRRFAAIMFAQILCSPHGLLSKYALFQQRLDAADAVLAVVLSLAENLEHPFFTAEMLQCRAEVAGRRRDANAALADLMRAQEITISTGDYATLATIKCAVGNQLVVLHAYHQAEGAMRDGLADATRAGHPVAVAQLTGQLGLVLLKSGRLDEACDRYEEAKRRYQDLGMPHGVAACAAHLAEIADRQGRDSDAWALHCESLAADLEADNLVGVFGSLEQLAGRVRTDEQLRFVLERSDEIAAYLPPATRHANVGFLDRAKAGAYISANRLDRAKESLLQSLSRLPEADYRSRGIVLGQLSKIVSADGEFGIASDYNRRSRLAYEEAQDIDGVLTCRHNGVSFAVELGDVTGAIDEGCEAILGAAMLGDLKRVTQTAMIMAQLILPRLDRLPELLEPAVEDDFVRLMGILAGAAQQRDLGRVFGTLRRLTSRFGPGGIEHDGLSPPGATKSDPPPSASPSV